MSGAAGGLAGGCGPTWTPSWSAVRSGCSRGRARPAAGREFDAITGEGRLDRTTGEGKLVAEVARRCGDAGVRCCAIVGGSELSEPEARELGLSEVREAGDPAAILAAAQDLVSPSRRRSSHVHPAELAAGDVDHLAVDVVGQRRGEEQHRPGGLLGLRRAARAG